MRNFKIDNKSCFDFNIALLNRNIRAIPDVKINEFDITGRDGVLDSTLKFGKNTVKLTVECFDTPSKIYDNIRNFINYLNPRLGSRELIFDDELDKVRYVKLINSGEIDFFYTQALAFGKFDLEFSMADPFTYSANTKKFYFTGVSGATAKLMNNGGVECPVKVKIYAPKGTQTTKYEENNASVVYSGTWSAYSTSYFSGGNSKFSNTQGSYVELTFTGSQISIYGLKSAGKGIAKVTIDEVVEYADCYAPAEEWNGLLYTKNLDNGTHTIRIEVNGTRNSAAVGIQINLDYIEVVSSSISSEVLPLTVIGSKFSYSDPPTISNPKVTINDEYVQYKGDITIADEVIVDTDKFTLELNGTNKLSAWEGDFPKLKVGENIVSEFDDLGYGALVIFEFRERWL